MYDTKALPFLSFKSVMGAERVFEVYTPSFGLYAQVGCMCERNNRQFQLYCTVSVSF